MSVQLMSQIFIKISVNDASVKKHKNQQTVLSIFYSKRSYKMEYYLLLNFPKICIIFGGFLNFGCVHSLYFVAFLCPFLCWKFK